MMGEKNLLLRIGLLFFMVYMINSCGGERNEDVAQDQLHETIDSEIFDKHEKEKYFNLKEEVSFANEKDKCKLSTKQDGCIWGYEDSCKNGQRFLEPLCKDVKGYRHFTSLEERTDAFWTENDFGYVKNVKKLHMICEPNNQDDSSFECNEELTFCRGRNILMDFTYNGRSSYERVASKPFESGQFGGHCRLVSGQFKSKTIYRDKLRSWGVYDIDKFSSLTFKPSDPQNCDVFVDTPTIFADLDFIGNIYHHFCDFFNLYLTLHANNSLYSTFDVAKWSAYEQAGPFGDTWKAFTRNVYPLWSKYGYRKVCFKDVVFGLLPRMAYGLYYSTAVVEGCSRSGMFKAFSEYILDGLSIKRERKAKSDLLRVTLLYRSTRFRKIVNRDELINVMKSIPGIAVQSVDFNRDMPFLEQLAISANSDIFIGIHGAGLAHTLFLPDWAVLFELYNTEDYNCYRDLARLRGVTYVTWEKKEKLKDETLEPDPNYTYEKFRNYRFDVDEFQRLLGIAISHAKENIRVANL